ncbi:MAG: methyl-accepting chemotaxis protein, partial [Methanomicrobiales archaeon HGW-Methanomicrobiales-4]
MMPREKIIAESEYDLSDQYKGGVVGAITQLTREIQNGNLTARADPISFDGDARKILEEINNILDTVVIPLNQTAVYVERISRGDIPPKITESYSGDLIEIKDNLNSLIDVIHLRNDDIKMLITAALAGQLDVRADHSRYPGENGKMIRGINDMLDAYIGPINLSAEYIDRLSKGEVPPKITDSYNGDFNVIKTNLNTCIDAINLLVSDADMLAGAVASGKLKTRADATRHQGDFRKIVEGVNATLNSVITPFQVVHNQVGHIAASAEEAAASLEEVAAGAKGVTRNSEQVTKNTEKCNDSLLQVLTAVEDFSVTVGQVSGKADSVFKISFATNQLCEEGTAVAKKAEQGMDGITRSTSEVNEIVTDIGSQMHEIGKIVNLISDISKQTNLLALNAAIEAARAGDAGRGFAVVAAEVKSLAQESRRSAENITDMIQGLQQKSQAAAVAMETADGEVKTGNTAMK